MRPRTIRWTLGWLGVFALGGALLLSVGGCPIDSDAVLTDAVQAALNAAVSSFVEALSAYLAGN